MTVIGFDFGTTNSVISIVQGNRVISFLDEQGLPIPSVVCYEGQQTIVGRDARERVSKTGLGVHGNIVRSPKTLIGRESVFVGGVERNPVDVARDVIQYVRNQAESSTIVKDVRTDKAVVTIPINMDGQRRSLLRDAFRMAGINIVRFVHEPLAALYAHIRSIGDLQASLRRFDRQLLLVFDWGGGTLDLTLCRLIDGQLVQVGNDGADEVGGDIFDNELRNEVEHRFRIANGIPEDVLVQSQARTRLMHVCERAKIDLSTRSRVSVYVPNYFEGLDDTDLELTLEREELDKIVRHLVDKGLERIETLLAREGCTATSISMCLATGGMVNMPAINARLNEFFGPQRVQISERSASLISEGAAWIAHDDAKLNLAKNVELLLARNSYMPLLMAGLELPKEGEVRHEAFTLYCVDPLDGFGKFELVSPNHPGPKVNRGDPRRHLSNLVLKVDHLATPFRERLILDVEINEDLILHAKAHASNAGATVEVDVHDLEFALAFPSFGTGWVPNLDAPEMVEKGPRHELGAVVMRSNIAQTENWDLVPGEVVAKVDCQRLDRRRDPPQIQIEEYLYYQPCSLCGRPSGHPDCHCASSITR